MKRILITESQFKKIVDEVKYISRDELASKHTDDTLNFDVAGTYGIKDMDKFYNVYPFKTVRKLVNQPHFDSDGKATNWKHLTEIYPVVIIKIPLGVVRQKNYNSTYHKNARNKESYSFSDNELFVVFSYDGYSNQWGSKKMWATKQRPDLIKMLTPHLVNQKINEFANNLSNTSYFKNFNPTEILSRLSTILSSVPKTKQEDIFITDEDIDREFREPIRFTVRNGDDPKPIIDNVLKKYGRLSKSINDIVNSKTIEVLKHKRINPYL